MIHVSRAARDVPADIAERLTNPTSPGEPARLSGGTRSARFAAASDGLARTARAGAQDTVATIARTGKAETVANTRGPTAELVRAEAILQVAQEAVTAIAILYDGMRNLAELALDESLTEEQRVELDTAFRELKQDIDDIVEATVFDGKRLLEGGDGPDGEYVIRLSVGGASDALLEIFIPALGVGETLEAFEEADLLTIASARAAFELSGRAVETIRLLGDMIEGHREALQRIFSAEVDIDGDLADYIATFESPKYAEGLSHLVADVVLAGGGVPFEESADRLRDILARLDPVIAPQSSIAAPPRSVEALADPRAGLSAGRPEGRGPVEPTDRQVGIGQPVLPEAVRDGTAPMPRVPNVTTETARAVDGRGSTETSLSSMREKLMTMRALAQEVVAAGESAPGFRAERNAAFQAIKGQPDTFASTAPDGRGAAFIVGDGGSDGGYVIRLSRGEDAGTGYRIAVPSASMDDVLPAMSETDILTVGAARRAIGRIDRVVAGVIDAAVTDLRRTGDRGHPGRIDIDRAAPVDASDGLPPPTLHDFLSDTQRDRAMSMVPEIEPPKLRDLDAVRRGAGQAQQISDVDTIKEAGASLRSAIEEPLDRMTEHDAPLPVAPGGFMAELRRADGMLHVADLSIGQIDLHLDYMRGLAEEASSETSRARGALDELFQVVKSTMIDAFAQTAEAQGEKILAGGDGPNGEFVIRLSRGGDHGDGPEFAIPSMRIRDLSPDLSDAAIRTREAATAAAEHVDFAAAGVERARELIAEHRTLIRRLVQVEIAQNGRHA